MRFALVLFAILVIAATAPAAGAALPSVAPGFAEGALMNLARSKHTSTPLLDGRVLVTGGYGDSEGRSSELYDPTTDTWTPGPDMSTPRNWATATRLLDGRVLVVGGSSVTDSTITTVGTAEIYNPATNKWSPPASLQFPRWDHTATLMADGKVVIVGGIAPNGDPVGVAERYDPAVNAWSQAGTLAQARWGHIAVRLPNGKLFISSGGSGQGNYLSSELYDPANNGWSPGKASPTQRQDAHAELLANGKVIVVGRSIGPLPTTADLYDPIANTWSPTGSLVVTRNQFMSVVLADGRFAVFAGASPIGGLTVGSAEVYDPVAGTWSSLPATGRGRYDAQATVLADGRVLVTGGFSDSTGLATTDLYTLPTTVSLPAQLGLGESPVGEATTKSVQLTNTGAVPLLVADPEIGGRHAGEFALAGNTCTRPAGVAPGASCTLAVTFTPGTPGRREGTLTVQTNAATARKSIALDGTGVPAPVVVLPEVTPTATAVATPTPVATATPVATPKPETSTTVSIRFDGGYNLPPGVSRARACRGTVSLTLKRGNQILIRRTVNLDRRCRFKTSFKLSRKSLGGATRLTVVQRFNGNRALGKRTDRIRVRVP